MFRTIWQIMRAAYTRRRSGIDPANIEHLRADLRFRLAMMEYAYFGRTGRRVAKCLEDLKSLLGDKAMHRYLRSLDPDLRTQFVERFQGARREHESAVRSRSAGDGRAPSQAGAAVAHDIEEALAPNVVPFSHASRKAGGSARQSSSNVPVPNDGTRTADSGD